MQTRIKEKQWQVVRLLDGGGTAEPAERCELCCRQLRRSWMRWPLWEAGYCRILTAQTLYMAGEVE